MGRLSNSQAVRLAGAVVVALLATAVASASAAGGGRLVWSPPVGGWTAQGTVSIYGLQSVSCPSTKLCVASGTSGSVASTSPTGGKTAWTTMPTIGMRGVSCPSATFCVGVTPGNGTAGGTDRVYTSTDPAGGASAWRGFAIPHAPGQFWAGIACGSRSLCVAYESGRLVKGYFATTGGHVAVSTNPAGGTSAWKITSLRDVPSAAYCDGRTCVLGTLDGAVLTSANPASGHWRATAITGSHAGLDSSLGLLACTSSRYCIVGGNQTRALWYAHNPATTTHWTLLSGISGTAGQGFIDGIGCASTGRCVLASDELTRASNTAELISSPRPGAPWHAQRVRGQYFSASCPSETLCVAAGSRTYENSAAQVIVGRSSP